MGRKSNQHYIRDQLGFPHPIEALQQAIQNLKQQRIRIVQLPMNNGEREVFLDGIDAAIAEREAMIRQAVNGKE